MLLLLRLAAAIVGVVLFCQITAALLDGHITYSRVDIIDEERVTTKTLPEACAIWLTFSPIFVGLIIGGLVPQWYVEKPWLGKVLVGVACVGYVLSSLLS
jgi:hypothetical protein